MDTEILKEIGLNENEIKVYIILLRLGSSKVNEVYDKTKIPRSFIYEVLKSLIDKGLVSYVIKSGIRYYEAAKPLKLKEILKEKESKLDSILPELENIKKLVKKKPTVELYEGVEGIKTILEDILKMEKGEIMYAYSNEDIFKLLTFYFPNFIKRRAKKGIFGRIIEEDTEKIREDQKRDKSEYREMRITKIKFNSTTFIYGDKIALITTSKDEPIGVLIENKEMAETQKKVFHVLWEAAKA